MSDVPILFRERLHKMCGHGCNESSLLHRCRERSSSYAFRIASAYTWRGMSFICLECCGCTGEAFVLPVATDPELDKTACGHQLGTHYRIEYNIFEQTINFYCAECQSKNFHFHPLGTSDN